MRSGVESLTPSELRVASMAANGLSNPQIAQSLFVTRKTVEAHLGHIYRKLDVRSRDELGRALAVGTLGGADSLLTAVPPGRGSHVRLRKTLVDTDVAVPQATQSECAELPGVSAALRVRCTHDCDS
jgi:DNA-binding CsgD family transcriptional regulator